MCSNRNFKDSIQIFETIANKTQHKAIENGNPIKSQLKSITIQFFARPRNYGSTSTKQPPTHKTTENPDQLRFYGENPRKTDGNFRKSVRAERTSFRDWRLQGNSVVEFPRFFLGDYSRQLTEIYKRMWRGINRKNESIEFCENFKSRLIESEPFAAISRWGVAKLAKFAGRLFVIQSLRIWELFCFFFGKKVVCINWICICSFE